MQSNLSGRLPVLEGFTKSEGYSLDHYQRGYYQASIEVREKPAGGSVVCVTAKVTAWYADPSGAHSGYRLLDSNGRIEADLLDQLSDELASSVPAPERPTDSKAPPPPSPAEHHTASTSPPAAPAPAPAKPATEPAISAPSPQFPDSNQTFSSTLSHGLAPVPNAKNPREAAEEKADSALQVEADNLETILKNTAHPNNLVAIKKSGTPVVSAPSLTAKTEFLASAHDEFELLDFNADWVHVRISGLSRGWIWRDSVEMPDGIPDTADHPAATLTPAADLFHVSREETAPFPGDWQPLRSKNVKIITVQKVDESAKDAGPKERLEYAKFLMDKSYAEISQKTQELQGIVVIFDSADGGMIAATAATLQQWKSGTLTDSALWHACFFDPPETFDSSAPSGSK